MAELTLPASSRAIRRPVALATAAVVAVAAGAAAALAPAYRDLVWYGLYAIPSHLLVSVLPHEPALFYAAKLYPPPVVAATGTAACVAAGILDYWLVGWFVNHRLIRPRFERTRAFLVAEKYFRKVPFLLLAAAAFLPVPFYPVKFLAIAVDYPLPRFLAAVVLGRFPRFWLLALGGQRVQAPNSALVWIGAALVLVAIWKVWRVRRARVAAGASDA